jgi:hypothetical protein
VKKVDSGLHLQYGAQGRASSTWTAQAGGSTVEYTNETVVFGLPNSQSCCEVFSWCEFMHQ